MSDAPLVATSLQTTPQRWRRRSAMTAIACIVLAIVGFVNANDAARATQDIRDATGPVLVASQNLRASLAEADAAQASAFLSAQETGAEDRRARRSYEDALRRANEQVEDVSALIGDDDATHAAIKDVSVLITRYSGLVEAARAARPFDDEVAVQFLSEAVNLLDGDLQRAVGVLQAASAERLEQDTSSQSTLPWLGIAAGLVALAITALGAADLTRSTNRVVNAGLTLAALSLAGALGWLVIATTTSSSRVNEAVDGGYRSIVATSQLQEAGFTVKSAQTLELLTGDRDADRRIEEGREQVTAMLREISVLSDTDRESALALETQQRWDRFTTASDGTGDTTSSFNGFVFSVEGVLADNRDQFLAGIGDASRSLNGLGLGMIGLPLLAGLAALAGFQQRINEYR